MVWPQLLSPFSGVLAAGLALGPLVLLYFLKLRRQERVISSTLLWKKAIQDLQVNSPFQRLRRNLLLLLQLLLLGILCIALARPVIGRNVAWGKMCVLLIDRSGSMSARMKDGRSRLQVAQEKAIDLISTLGRNAQGMVIAFDDSAETIVPFTTDAGALKRAVLSIVPTDRPTRLKMAYQLAEAQLAFIPEMNRTNIDPPQVWLLSDGRVLDGTQLRLSSPVNYVRIGDEESGNVAVAALSARRNFQRPTEVQIFARLENHGPLPVQTDVALKVNGVVRRVSPRALALPPARWSDPVWRKAHPDTPGDFTEARDSIEFTLDLPDAAVASVEALNVEGDALDSDNSASVVLPPARSVRLLLVSRGNYFLEKAVHSLDLKQAPVWTAQRYEADKPVDFDVIIFDRHDPQWLPGAGAFLYFAALPPGTPISAAADGSNRRILARDVSVLDWQRDHPLLKNISLARLYVAQSLELKLPLEAQVLADSLSGPLLALYRQGRRTHLLCSFDVLQSNWPLKVSFPIFLSGAAQYLALGGQMAVRESYQPGTAIRVARAGLENLPATVRVEGPITRVVSVPPSGDIVLPPLDQVGVYRTVPPLAGYEQITVNLLDSNESNLMAATAPPGELGQALAASQVRGRQELWWWLLAVGAAPLLLAEWWVYVRRAG